MKIIVLVENTSSSPKYKCKHGLSLYIETPNHKMLFDLGSDKLFLKNAKKLGVDISSIDTVLISHGHKDHGGALNLFLQENRTAKVYVRKSAFQPYYTKFFGIPVNVGLDSSLKSHPQIILTDKKLVIDDELTLFSNVSEKKYLPVSNNSLFIKKGKDIKLDNFEHEQHLLIKKNDKHTLIAGCAHSGIVNIQNQAHKLLKKELDLIVSGFHLFNPISKKGESENLISEIAKYFEKHNTKYYTCHCTGQKAFNILKQNLGEQISYLSTGSILKI